MVLSMFDVIKIFKLIFLILYFSLDSCSQTSNKLKKNKVNESKVVDDTLNYQIKIESNDTCFIKSNSIIINQEYQCKFYSFVDEKYYIDNSDFGILIYVLNNNTDFKLLELYSSSTGRKKLVFLSNSKLLESEWFDDDASGDYIQVETVNGNGFFSFDENTNKKTFVNWLKGYKLVKSI